MHHHHHHDHHCGHHHHEPHCGCNEQIVYPVDHDVVHNCCERTVEHVHPSHTTVVNHHLTRNVHLYPQSTSVENTFDSVDIYGGTFEVPAPPQPTVGFAPGGFNPTPGPDPAPGVMPELGGFGPENPGFPPINPW